ncbi:MAG: hypothetical protein WBC44_00865 [Planctomycetaceae bacterium]
MSVVRFIVFGMLLACERSRGVERASAADFDFARLAARPLPAGLRLHRHPREIPTARVREITGGRVG